MLDAKLDSDYLLHNEALRKLEPRNITVYTSSRDAALLVIHDFWNGVYPGSMVTFDDPETYDTPEWSQVRSDPDRTDTPSGPKKFINLKTGKEEDSWPVEFRGNHANLTPKAYRYILKTFNYYPILLEFSEEGTKQDRLVFVVDNEIINVQNQ